MKTIHVPDELYDAIMNIANEIEIQDNRITAKPYLFQIRTEEKVWVGNLNGDHKVILSNDLDEVGPYAFETIAQIAVDREIALPENVSDDDDLSIFDTDVFDWLDKNGGYRVETYSIRHKLENAFFTAKACQAHIKGNSHHYNNPTDYLSHAFRNNEMAAVFDLLTLFVDKDQLYPF